MERAWALSPHEVIVVDGGSEDETEQLARQGTATVVRSARGRGPQQNVGAAIATGDVLLFLHADTWLEPDGANQLNARLANTDTQFGAFHHWIQANGLRYRMLEWGNAFRAKTLRTPYGDQGLFFRRSFFESIGGFPSIPLMEDLRLMRSLRRTEHCPAILPGPLHVSARRWLQRGVLRQTLSNWSLAFSDRRGTTPDVLSDRYNASLNSCSTKPKAAMTKPAI
ncbi:Glycosyl transferase family 2 [Adhaeretor mobilis]|uniref:Glycosyl transferase family 2 n=2 Tax=Adhaeretor mobilis TaxID=1930276 RepID=A0A517MUI3_9BACT|nr:Glycosyl transferase family 2 [Adhaeretor mobilis]